MSLKRVINKKVIGLLRGFSSRGEAADKSVDGVADAAISMAKQRERPTRSFEDFFAHLKRLGFSPSVCIDVGAAKGTMSIYRSFPDALHIAFEPLPDFQDELRETLRPYAHEIKNCALSNESGQTTLLRHNDLFGSSIMHSRDAQDENVVTIRQSTLDVELTDFELSGPVILKTDCQGSDLLVLQGGIETLAHCEVVIVEASLFRFWGPHQPDFFDIVTFMHEQGFALYDILDGLYRPRDAALGQIDLVFAKERSSLRQDHYW